MTISVFLKRCKIWRIKNEKRFFYRIKEFIFRYGFRWDLLSPSAEEAKEFAHKNINEEPKKKKEENFNKLTAEKEIVEYSTIINRSFRYEYEDPHFINLSKKIEKYKLKKDIVVYRGVHNQIMDKMIENAKLFSHNNIDYFEKGFLNTSLVKGQEINCEIKLRIKLPKGTCAFYAGDVNGEENSYFEVIVQKGARLKILSKDKDYINCILLGTD